MVNWKDPEVEVRLGVILNDMVFFVVGLYGWEYFRSFQVEWALIRFRLSFRWPLIPYVVGRLSLLASVIMLAVIIGPTSRDIDCAAVIKFISFAGNVAVGCASTNLMIRTWLIWKDSRFVLCLLSLVSVAHWTVLILALTSIDASMTSGGCEVVYVETAKALAVYLFTMFYDMLVLVLTTIGLSRKQSNCTLWRRLYRQGIAYFAMTFLANIMPLVLCWLDLNAILPVLFAIPATCLSTISSSMVVKSLLNPDHLRSSDASSDDTKDANTIALTTQIPLPT
ncbi:hypothetical protein BDN67DRAFT_969579 [Paxillus ammoniavirescens]|nr:hypothetical protein BDN67DRAFT_969579 [Paxillus ammoniavirescens]